MRSVTEMPPKKLPRTLDELYAVGGPAAYIAAAERRAGDQEAQWWLDELESRALPEMDALTDPDGFADSEAAKGVVEIWIRQLRGRLGLKAPPDVVRAQTRERVRRLRARRAEARSRTAPR
jgi:hypothetical protein